MFAYIPSRSVVKIRKSQWDAQLVQLASCSTFASLSFSAAPPGFALAESVEQELMGAANAFAAPGESPANHVSSRKLSTCFQVDPSSQQLSNYFCGSLVSLTNQL